MSLAQVRGGYPHVFRDSAVTAVGRKHAFPFTCFYLQARAQGNPCKMFFTEADYLADNTNYVIIPVASFTTSERGWEGPVEIADVWLKGIGGNAEVEIVAYQRRG